MLLLDLVTLTGVCGWERVECLDRFCFGERSAGAGEAICALRFSGLEAVEVAVEDRCEAPDPAVLVEVPDVLDDVVGMEIAAETVLGFFCSALVDNEGRWAKRVWI